MCAFVRHLPVQACTSAGVSDFLNVKVRLVPVASNDGACWYNAGGVGVTFIWFCVFSFLFANKSCNTKQTYSPHC